MYWDIFIKLTFLSVLGIVSPGPDFFVVTRASLFYSKEAALWAVAGIATGSFIHIQFIFWGLEYLSHESFFFQLILIVGASYLIWLGVQSLLEAYRGMKLKEGRLENPKKLKKTDFFRIGLVTNLTNAQAIFFMVSFFAILIPDHMPVIEQISLYGWRLLMGVSWFVFIAIFFSHHRVRDRFLKYSQLIQAVMGVALCFLGGGIFVSFLKSVFS